MVLKEKKAFDTVVKDLNHWFPDRIKFCLDRKRRVIALDRELGIGAGRELTDQATIEELTEIVREWIL